APPSIGFQDGGLRLFDLQEQRIGLITPDEQDDPCARAHTADSNNLTGDIDVAILLHELAAVNQERLPVIADEVAHDVLDAAMLLSGQELLQTDDQRRAADDLQLTIHAARQPFERAHVVFGVRFRYPQVQSRQLLWSRFPSPPLANSGQIQPGIPDSEI